MIFFENIRFNEGEIKDDNDFAKCLSLIGEIYINDAFSCSHRKQASIHKITKYIKHSYAGPLFMKEIISINMVLSKIKKSHYLYYWWIKKFQLSLVLSLL